MSLPAIFNRSIWYDEALSLLITSGNSAPSWPTEPAPASIAKEQLTGTVSIGQVARDIRDGEVSPLLYFCTLSIWRQLFGDTIEAARTFSLFCFFFTIITAYLFLRAIKTNHPVILTLLYITCYHAVYMSGEARPYAMANMLLIAGMVCVYASAFLYFASPAKTTMCRIAAPVFLAMAFYTQYLVVFSIASIFGWNIAVAKALKKGRKLLHLLFYPLATLLICLPWAPALLQHTSARPEQATGAVGTYAEFNKLFWLNFFNIFHIPGSIVSGQKGTYLFILIAMVLFALITVTLLYVVRSPNSDEQKGVLLILFSAAAPSAGLFLLDSLFDKNLSAARYLYFGLFPTIALLFFGLCQGRHKSIFYITVVAFVFLQILGTYWSTNRAYYHDGSYARLLAAQVADSSRSNRIVAIMAGKGRGIPAAVIYELPERQTILVITKENFNRETIAALKGYDEIWVALAYDDSDYVTMQKRLVGTILNDTNWKLAINNPGYLCLQKV